MRTLLKWAWAPAAAAVLLVLTLSSPFWAGGAKDNAALDKTIHANLKLMVAYHFDHLNFVT